MKLSNFYILDKNNQPQQEPDVYAWLQWWQRNRKRRTIDQCSTKDGTYVSTVFLGFDHSIGEDAPILWETYDSSGEVLERYATREEALQGHKRTVSRHGGKVSLPRLIRRALFSKES